MLDINPFAPSAPFLYPHVFRGSRKSALGTNGLIEIKYPVLHILCIRIIVISIFAVSDIDDVLYWDPYLGVSDFLKQSLE